MFVGRRMFKWFLAPSALLACTFWFFGVAGCLMLLGYAACSILLLEGVNYIEHYGLVRAKLPNGRYAPVGPQHSWDADWRLTNAVMYKLQRHAHHHMNASKPYQVFFCMPYFDNLCICSVYCISESFCGVVSHVRIWRFKANPNV